MTAQNRGGEPCPAIVDAVVQVHLTRSCNLRCRHCYSMSGPDQRERLDPEVLLEFLADAWEAGYRRVSFSGGEPLLYQPLRTVLQAARSLGMTTSVTTNGTVITPVNARWLAELVDVLAVSLDGVPASHNRIRGSERAFEWTERGLGHLERAGARFATIFTLTAANLAELPWVAALTAGYGGVGVQVHPLESVGAAALHLPDEVPDAAELAQAWFAALGTATLHADVADVRLVARSPELVLGPEPGSAASLAAAVRPLVLEADGTMVPLTYGFPRRYRIGNLAHTRLRDVADPWLRTGYPPLRDLIAAAVTDLTVDPPALPFVNWFEFVARVAARRTLSISPTTAVAVAG